RVGPQVHDIAWGGPEGLAPKARPWEKARTMDSFGTLGTLDVSGKSYSIRRLKPLYDRVPQAASLPFSLKVLLENLLRHEDGRVVKQEHVLAVASWDPKAQPTQEINFYPARVLLQDFTGVPAVADLAAMR